jgi:acylphosphatase
VIAEFWTIHGIVQGVGYRDAMAAAARAARVNGFVRNRRDGTVEAFVQGEAEALARLRTWCMRGPPAARVTEITVRTAAYDATCTRFSRAASL